MIFAVAVLDETKLILVHRPFYDVWWFSRCPKNPGSGVGRKVGGFGELE